MAAADASGTQAALPKGLAGKHEPVLQGRFQGGHITGGCKIQCKLKLPGGFMRQWRVYHFRDTGDGARVKQPQSINDHVHLREDAGNLAAFLYLLRRQHSGSYQRIVKTVHLIAPFFADFHLHPSPENPDMIELEWVEQGRDVPLKAHYLSDGTLRFICLATVFLQPSGLQPETLFVDKPELGLHPYSINVLASLIRATSREKQVIISTQSVDLLNQFEPEDVIVVDRHGGRSALRRLHYEALAEWLNEYTLGQLWEKNMLGGRPGR